MFIEFFDLNNFNNFRFHCNDLSVFHSELISFSKSHSSFIVSFFSVLSDGSLDLLSGFEYRELRFFIDPFPISILKDPPPESPDDFLEV